MSEEQAKYDNKMSFTDAIRILNDFITTDRAIRDFRVESDFDQFCENRCIAIEMLIKMAKVGEMTIKQHREIKKEVQKLEKLRKELKQG